MYRGPPDLNGVISGSPEEEQVKGAFYFDGNDDKITIPYAML